ncbi:MAG: hypothetical protein A2Z02_07035 [Chloroflexi bacterium RBG_16_48_7]|nr:MAG: hypothetical protein A2Z02_07035 [Chloroflexi bacterium RBG_16_48_7]
MKILPLKQLFILPAILAIISVSACSAELPVIKAQDASAPSIKILVPGNNPRVGLSGDSWCPVLVDVNNFKLVNKPGEPNVTGEGHIHYFLDIDPSVKPGKPSLIDDAIYAESVETIYFWPQVGKGQHTFWAELVNNDHTPLNPPALAKAGTSAGNYWDS